MKTLLSPRDAGRVLGGMIGSRLVLPGPRFPVHTTLAERHTSHSRSADRAWRATRPPDLRRSDAAVAGLDGAGDLAEDRVDLNARQRLRNHRAISSFEGRSIGVSTLNTAI